MHVRAGHAGVEGGAFDGGEEALFGVEADIATYGKVVGGVSYVPGIVGQAFNFNGQDRDIDRTTTIDLACPDGSAIPIEERSSGEVLSFAGHAIGPEGVSARDAAIDVTTDAPTITGIDILLNASPVGMLTDPRTPVDVSAIAAEVIVFDAIVKPEPTKLLPAALA